MRLTLAFVNSAPGHGLIRARVNDGKTVTVGRYERSADGNKWTAYLYAKVGKRSAIAAEITATSLYKLRGAVGKRLGQGKWWQ